MKSFTNLYYILTSKHHSGGFKRPTPGFRRQGGLEPPVQVSGNTRAPGTVPAQEQERVGGVLHHRALPDVGHDQAGGDHLHRRMLAAGGGRRPRVPDIFYVT